jgi:TetR/AcrR family transcriptional regulator of autoinduction and epiphytic fitness
MAAVPARRPEERVDGRVARSRRTRAAVIDAFVALLEEGDLRPTAPRIAERAGVSVRSVFQHFEDMETVFRASAARELERLSHLLGPGPLEGSFERRMVSFTARRTRLLEAMTPVRRAAGLMEPFSPEIHRWLDWTRHIGREEVHSVFTPELAELPPARRREVLQGLVAVGSWTTWEELRAEQGLPQDQARRVVRRLMRSLVEGARSSS